MNTGTAVMADGRVQLQYLEGVTLEIFLAQLLVDIELISRASYDATLGYPAEGLV
jgi:hypothetical protein